MDDIVNNVIYRTGPIFTEMRTIYHVGLNETYLNTVGFQDRDVYVIARSAGRIVNYALAPTITTP